MLLKHHTTFINNHWMNKGYMFSFRLQLISMLYANKTLHLQHVANTPALHFVKLVPINLVISLFIKIPFCNAFPYQLPVTHSLSFHKFNAQIIKMPFEFYNLKNKKSFQFFFVLSSLLHFFMTGYFFLQIY